MKTLAGIDWTPSGWTLTAQIIEDYVSGKRGKLERETHEPGATLSVSNKVFHETLELSISRYQGFAHGDSYSSCSADLALTDSLHFMIGGDFFGKGNNGEEEYSSYDRLSCIYLKGKYSF